MERWLNPEHTGHDRKEILMECRYEVVGFGLDNRTEFKGKRFDTVEELTSIGIDEIFIYD